MHSTPSGAAAVTEAPRLSLAARSVEFAARNPTLVALALMRMLNDIWLTAVELRAIAARVKERSPCNLLVFGAGNDSVFWARVNKLGRTVFLDDSAERIREVVERGSHIDARLVHYATRRDEWRDMIGVPRDLAQDLPEDVTSTRWDVVLVNAPRSQSPRSAARMQSIAAASRLVADGGHVFVHDSNRALERAYTDFYLKSANLVRSRWRLRHYRMRKSVTA